MSFLIKAVQDISYLTLALLPNDLSYSANRSYELGKLATSDPDMKMKMEGIASMLEEIPIADFTRSIVLSAPASPIDKEIAQIWKNIADKPFEAMKRGRELKCLWASVESFGLWGFSLSRAYVLGLNGPLIVTVVVLTPVVCFILSAISQQTRFAGITEGLFEWGQYMQNVTWVGSTGLFIANIAVTPRASILFKQLVVIVLTSVVFKKVITYFAYRSKSKQIQTWINDDKKQGVTFKMIEGNTTKTNYRELINWLSKLIQKQKESEQDPKGHNLSDEVKTFKEKMKNCLHVNDYVWVTKYLRFLEDKIRANA